LEKLITSPLIHKRASIVKDVFSSIAEFFIDISWLLVRWGFFSV